MRKLFLLECIIIALMVFAGGCASNSDYCCTSNDQCRKVNDKSTSCTMDKCGKCESVDLSLKFDDVNWQDAAVGQPYQVELSVSGGIPPYDWSGALTKLNDNENKLGWLVLVPDENNNNKAYLQNDKGVPQFPTKATIDGEALTITITVMDHTRHGKDMSRDDNKGAVFTHEIKITACTLECKNDDGCCPEDCNNINDNDCKVTCGNGVVENGETCDKGIVAGQAGACSTQADCDALNKNPCITVTVQDSGTCTAKCQNTPISKCDNDKSDLCCPDGCNYKNDIDCSAKCGNGVVDTGETCDPPSSCQTSCDDGNVCTKDIMTGSASTCNVACTHQKITACESGDGCCPEGCNIGNDSDCPPRCGDGVVSVGETCDPPSKCPTSCDDGNPCTDDNLTGTPDKCNVACSYPNKAEGTDCGNSNLCKGGVCTSCSGCWRGIECYDSNSWTDTNCGTGGKNPCDNCTTNGESCVSGTCSCPGCMSGEQCLSGMIDSKNCGKNGNPCRSCPYLHGIYYCSNGDCVPMTR